MNIRIVTTFVVLGVVTTIAMVGAFFGTSYHVSAANASSQQNMWDKEIRSLAVTGISTAKVSPDLVTVSFAVDSEEKSAQQATQTNARVTANVIEALRSAGLSESEISTSNYNVYPIYEYGERPAECIQYGEGDKVQQYCPPLALKQILVGYKAVNGVVVESEQLDRVGQWIDAAVAAGANRVDYLYFYVTAEGQDEIRNDLIAKAVQDARGKATTALEPLGMEIVDVLSINLDSYPIIYGKRGYEYAAGAPSSTTPIIPGAQEVSATIHATFEIGGFAERQATSNTTVQTSVNQEFDVTLDSNPTTGYQWHVTSIDETIVRLVNDEYVPPESALVGAGGKQVFTFEALKEGTTSIELEYARPWEPESPVSVYSLKLVVSAKSQ